MGRRALVAGGLIGAALCFSLGWLASRAFEPQKREPTATPSSEPTSINADDGGAAGPLILIDPSKATLLPDASLNFQPPTPPSVPGQTYTW